MNKKYEGILKAADNVGSAAVLTICIAILRIVMNPGLQSVEIKDIIVNYSGSLFIFVGCFCCAIWELAWFTQYVPLKIQYGNTRKQIFLQEKWMKFLSTAGISAISFIILLACGESLDGVRIIGTIGSLLLIQTLCEFISAVYLRFRRMMMVMIVAIAGCIGFVTAYVAMGIMKKGELAVPMKFAFLQEHPVHGVCIMLLIFLVLTVLSWIFLKKAEIRE